jgi:Rps23 Pro-64 3,4-dihydroxylase Tpa1-like proline 4-hydroxylase
MSLKMVSKKDLILMIHQKLESSSGLIREQWSKPNGTKTRHAVIDNLLDPRICHEVYNAFPLDTKNFYSMKSFRERKRTSSNLSQQKKILSDLTYALQDKKVVNLIESLVGFKKLVPDPNLYAGGISMMFKGDFLNPHIDNSHDKHKVNYRRLNILFYVSPNWNIKNGGNFELWNEAITKPKTIPCFFNRLIIMETNKTSWHSVSPVKISMPRCCVSIYYYSKESPHSFKYFHVTSFVGRPNEKIKRALSIVDNNLRNAFANLFRIWRGESLSNKKTFKKK